MQDSTEPTDVAAAYKSQVGTASFRDPYRPLWAKK
jgi:hypothetical protein